MVNYEIQYTGKFDMLTYVFGTNSVLVLSPDCTDMPVRTWLSPNKRDSLLCVDIHDRFG